MASHGQSNPAVAKKLLDSMQNDLRTLSAECKRKHPEVKEYAEMVQVKLRTISTQHDDIIAGLLSVSADVVQPFVMGCVTKNPKLLPLCLVAVQRMISHEAISTAAADAIIGMLWHLMEAGLEELKLLQTAILLLTINSVVQHDSLAKALVLCFRLHFTKDSTTINTAAAAIKQLVSAIFDRVVIEDRILIRDTTEAVNLEELKAGSKIPPKSLRPCAGDAYLLFQDLCQLVNADQPFWLTGMTEMTRTFGLELLESVLTSYPSTFSLHPEFTFMLKERVCPLVIKLFSPSLKYRQGLPPVPSPAPVEKPFFPIVMRLLRIVSVLIKSYYPQLVTECEIFLSLLVKFLDPEKPIWQRCLSLEVLHKLSVQPELIKCFCQSYDMKPHSTKIFRDIVNALGAFIQSLFMNPQGGPVSQTVAKVPDTQGTPPALVGGMPVGGGVSPQPAFIYRGVWIPLISSIPHGQVKPCFLELLDKTDPPPVPDGYGVSLAFRCLMDMTKSVQTLVMGEGEEGEPKAKKEIDVTETSEEDKLLKMELINSSWCGMLAALSLLLDASTDETATEMILKAQESYANMCGHLAMSMPRDAFITALCKASLPPHYTLTILNSHANSGQLKVLNRTASMESQSAGDSVERSQVVAVGTALPTANLPAGSHQSQVMLTAKNIQVMRALLSLAHCHGDILGSAWHLVLTTLQHLVWILGLKPSSGGSLKAGQQISDTSNTVITTAVMADLPVLSGMLSRLFESSQYLDDVALHHLIDALCKLSTESMEVAYNNREPSLFAVAKLLESGLVNLGRVEVLWRPVTAHLLEVCQHSHAEMRSWGAEAVTSLVKAALAHKYEPPLHENLKLQSAILLPLEELSTISYSDIRQKQLDSVSHVLHNNGHQLLHGWPTVLGIIGAVTKEHGEKLIQQAFQCLQLVVTDFLPIIRPTYLQVVVQVAARFGLQQQELNVSLTAIGLLWNISDFFFQNRQVIKQELDSLAQPASAVNGNESSKSPGPFDALWMCLFSQLGELCVDSRPAVRKSAGQTLFSTISAHGSLLQHQTWHNVLWQVLFPLLENVQKFSSSASTIRDKESTGNILIHHSRDTAEKQWAETRVLSLAGVARTFNSKRKMLQGLGDFPRAWSLLLDHIELSALCRNSEVALAALKSFQEILQIGRASKGTEENDGSSLGVEPPTGEVINRSGELTHKKLELFSKGPISDSSDNDIPLWTAAWKVWLNIGTEVTKPPEHTEKMISKVYLPSQQFLTAMIQTFPPLFEHIKSRFLTSDLQKLSTVLRGTLCVPVQSDSSPFIIPSYPEVSVTPLQEAALSAMDTLIKTVQSGPETMQAMYPDIFQQLLTFVSFGVNTPKFGEMETKTFGIVRGPQADWVIMNFVPFAERAALMTVDLYRGTASHPAVINANILQNILKTFRLPLGLKYDCPSPTTWMLVADSLFVVLAVGLPVARQHRKSFPTMWSELAGLFEDFLFSQRPCPATLSVEDFQRDEAFDCRIVQLIRDDILPHAGHLPQEFMVKVMDILNKGSIHSTTSDSFVDTESSRKLREDFARTCFETLLQFSFVSDVVSEQGQLTRLAVMSLLRRCHDVITKYVEDERLSGKCPLPRARLVEMSSVLKAIATLLKSLKKAPKENVEPNVWSKVIKLYPALVECTTSPSPHVSKSLRDVLHEFCDLLAPPSAAAVPNGR
ncbi:protein MON2 homolog isoform X4 [Biomphalaria glabrata]|uniref:Protein MON2 homolog n=1 Tax=Biomphalaria glabrata TaxID=6526 RepID=A0A9W3A631_BIOGL|nr:protein MON2 homolog isoform X4 [Biomphalaria glabrata]